MSAFVEWKRYRGTGVTGAGRPVATPGEPGRYLADAKLVTAVNTALAVKQPLLVTGEPGTGKTKLAWSIAGELDLGDVLEFHTRSDHQARDVLYEFDYLGRFYHAQTRDPRVEQLKTYVKYGPLGEAIRSATERVVLIDEIDKAPRDFPNDLLDQLDRMQFQVPELDQTFVSTMRPVVVITSNSERQLPDPFLRRCVFHRIEFPGTGQLEEIVRERLGDLQLSDRLVKVATARFEQIRAIAGLEKKPSTAELLAWVRVLRVAGVDTSELERLAIADLPFMGAVAKSEQDQTVLAAARG